MSHELTIDAAGNVEAAFTVDMSAGLDVPWHGLGTYLDKPMTSTAAMKAARLDWTVEQRRMAVGIERGPQADKPGTTWTEQPNMAANVRSDTGMFLGNVSDSYKVVQNCEAFQFIDSLVDDGSMRYVSAFSMMGGKKVVLLAILPQFDEIAPDDVTLRYLVMGLNHDGSGAIKFGPTSVRCVCWNTYSVALAAEDSKVRELSISHTGNMAEKLADAKRILTQANEQFDRHADESRALADVKISAADWTRYLNICCPLLDPADPDHTDRRAQAIIGTRRAITEAYLNPRQNFGSIGETAWAAYNAVSEHIDHLPRRGANQTRRAEARFNVSLYGAGRDMKDRAFAAAQRIAEQAS
jgi:phage/plasmid-like protein (TIGR03299 family)